MLKMDIIQKSVAKILENLDLTLCYSESNLQRLLQSFLSQHGTVQSEVILPYYCDGIYFGSGRMDLVWQYKPPGTETTTTYILELKKCDRQYAEISFYPQVRKYLKHYPYPATGILVVFCPYKSICRVIDETTGR